MKKLREIVESDKYKPQNGESEIVHHATPYDFDEFHPMSHFGTHQAARDTGASILNNKDDHPDAKLKYFTARLKMGNVLNIPDLGFHDSRSITHYLHDEGHITPEEKKHIFNSKNSNEALANVLRNKGIHTLSYTNDYEAKGSKSYIITHPSQVRILRKGNLNISPKRKVDIVPQDSSW